MGDFQYKAVSLNMLTFALVSSGTAAVPHAPSVTLQSPVSRSGDALHSITNEGLFSSCSFYCNNTV